MMTPGQMLLIVQGILYFAASVAYFTQGAKSMAVVMASYGVANFALIRLT